MTKTRSQINKRRYKLYYLLRKAGYVVHTADRTVDVAFIEFQDKTTPEPYNRYIQELHELNNYEIQSTI